MTAVKNLKRMFRGRRTDERGATFIFTAICMVALLGAGAMGVDLGFSVYGSRQAQAMADSAALDLARYLSYADSLGSLSATQTYLNTKLAGVDTDNSSNAVLTVVPGLWQGGVFTKNGFGGTGCQPNVAPPAHPGCNAIEVVAKQSVPQIFFGGFNLLPGHAGNTASGSVSGSSIAANTPMAGFSIGSYLANVNTQQSGVLNAILSPLGTSANLTAVGYQGLANTDVTLAQLIAASGNVLSTSNVMSASLSAAQWLTIYKNAVSTQQASVTCGATPTPSVCNANTALGQLSFSSASSTNVKLCQLVNVSANSTNYNCGNTSISTQGLNASVNVFQMLTTEAELANGSSGIDVTTALNLTDGLLNIGSVKLYLTVIQPVQVAYGPVGTVAKTAQVTSRLDLTLSTLGLSLGTLSIPLSAASGTATLNSVTCVNNAMQSTKIIGSTNALTAGVTLNGANVATLGIGGASNASATYSGSVVPPTASTQAAGSNPVTIQAATLTPSFTGLAGGLNGLVAGLLTAASPLGAVLVPTLQAAGVTAAGAQIADLSTNCGSVSLVQ